MTGLKRIYSFLIAFLGVTLFTNPAFAVDLFANDPEIEVIARNIIEGTSLFPALAAALAYLSGIMLIVLGLFKTIDHVNSPTQVPLRVPVIRMLVGGALFSLPAITEASINLINGGSIDNFELNFSLMNTIMGWFGVINAVFSLGNANSVMAWFLTSLTRIPAFVAAVAYMLGIVTLISAIYKTRDHVEEPERNALKDAVIRYITAGALFGLPTVYASLQSLFQSDSLLGGVIGIITDIGLGTGFFLSSYMPIYGNCQLGSYVPPAVTLVFNLLSINLTNGSIGAAICQAMVAFTYLPFFLTMIAYLIGLALGLWGILKIRDHVTSPQQTGVNEGITRLLAAGAFFTLPYIVTVITYSVTPVNSAAMTWIGSLTGGGQSTTFAGVPAIGLVCDTDRSLSVVMGCMMADIVGPLHLITNFFCYCAGMIFIMIGISRIIKSSQEGARGPGGRGTVATFVIGGILISANVMLTALGSTLFGAGAGLTRADLVFDSGLSPAELQATYNVINATLQFMFIVGFISFVRGIFIIRGVAEGDQQASLMSGITHMVGGSLAANLGPVMNAVQATLGISGFGIEFT
ncbi:MAG: hypothetical protein GC137_07015 [Alphaproteobacteria bacterium]|nr:hypothetical protein [Alphaproteobacteria bacterium]